MLDDRMIGRGYICLGGVVENLKDELKGDELVKPIDFWNEEISNVMGKDFDSEFDRMIPRCRGHKRSHRR